MSVFFEEAEEVRLERILGRLDDLSWQVAMVFAEMAETLYEILERVYSAANAGQQMTLNEIIMMVDQMISEWAEIDVWPWVETGEFSEIAYGAHESAEQSLSICITECQEVIDRKTDQGQNLDMVMQALAMLI